MACPYCARCELTQSSYINILCYWQGTISVGIDATDLFDRYEEDFEDVVGGGVPHVEINKMHISQSIEVMSSFKSSL